MRVLHFITELHEGGAENALCQVVTHQKALGIDVAVACQYGIEGPPAERLKTAGIRVDCLHAPGLGGMWKWRKIKNIVKDFSPDLVHSWLFHANFCSKLFIRKNIPLCISLRVVEPRRSHICLDRLTRKRAQRVFCVSNEVMDYASGTLEYPRDICRLIENGVDFDFYTEARKKRQAETNTDNSEKRKLRLLTVARVAEQKGMDILAEALGRLHKNELKNLDWNWTIIGNEPEPDYAERLREQINRIGISDKIIFAGKLPRNQVNEYYATADLVVLPSRWEGQANVPLEAAACGLPTMASANCGHGKEAPIIVVEPNNSDAWQKAIKEYLELNSAEKEKLAQASIDWAESRSWDAITRQYIEQYEELLQNK